MQKNRLLHINEIVSSISETHKFNQKELKAINTSDIENGEIHDLNYTPVEKLKGQFKKSIKNGDILFSEIRPANRRFAKVQYLLNEEEYIVSTKLMVLRKFNDDVDLNFFYYCLTNQDFLNILQMRAENRICSFPQITFELLSEYTFFIPSLDVQKKIVSILFNIDKKISNNNNIQASLESMAKLIYDYWFVQFDFPDENGRPYKSSGGKMVWNEELKREIPEGWEAKQLGDIFSFVKGKIPENTTANPREDMLPYYTIDAIEKYPTEYCSVQGKIITNGETIMIMDGAASGEVYVGFSGVLASTFAKLEISDHNFNDNFLYFIMKKYECIFKKVNTGSTVPHANKDYILSFRIVVPEKGTLKRLSKVFNLICEEQKSLRKENIELTSLRDFLLPMLMNGQVTIKDQD